MKETPFRPPQPCPPPSRTPPLSPGLSTAPVPAGPPAAHSNLLRNGHGDRGNPCPQGGPPRSVGWSQKGRSCRPSGQAATRAAPAARGRGTADATRRGPRGRGMGRRLHARSSRAGRGARRVPARDPALLGAAAHAGGHVHLPSSLSWLFPNPAHNPWYRASERSQLSFMPVFPEQVQRVRLKQSL